MQINIFENIIEKVECGKKIVSPTKYYTKHYSFDTFSYYVRSMQFCIFKYSINA